MRRKQPETEAELHGCYSGYLQESWKAYLARRRWPRSPDNFVRSITSVVPLTAKVIDIGASVGSLVIYLREKGYAIDGVDGSDGIEEITEGLVKRMDLVSDDCAKLFGRYDWGLFFDVGEHVPKAYEDVLVANVAQIPTFGLMMSWSATNTEQGDHVNLKDEADVVEMFGRHGWVKDEVLTARCRQPLGRGWMARHRSPFVLLKS